MGFPDGSVGKESACSARDAEDIGSIPGSGRSPGEGNGRRAGGLRSMGLQRVRPTEHDNDVSR